MKGWTKRMRLDCNATQRRSSLRLVIQDDTVFILSYNEHRPWNIIEGQGRVMTKGNKVSEECFLRRRAFIITGNGREQITRKKKGYHMTYR